MAITKRKLQDQASVDGQIPASSKGKELFASNFKMLRQAWSGLSKFIKRTCDKGRAVDTQMVGIFVPQILEGGNIAVDFYPNPEYQSSGKFKLPRHIARQLTGSYEEFYSEKL